MSDRRIPLKINGATVGWVDRVDLERGTFVGHITAESMAELTPGSFTASWGNPFQDIEPGHRNAPPEQDESGDTLA